MDLDRQRVSRTAWIRVLEKATETHKEGYCDYIYDTFHCIHPIPAGETLYYQCSYADTAICNDPPTLTLPAANSSFCRGTAADNSPIQYYASRKCYENATWEPKAYDALCDLMETDPTIFRNSTSELDRHQTLDKIYYHCSIWPPLLSVICLIVACFLFNVKTLRCTRIFIHQNLIIAWIFKYSLSIIVFLIGRGITAGIEETAAGDASGSSQMYVQEDSQQYLPVYTTGNGSYSYDYAADYYASSGNGYGPPISSEKSRSPWNDPQVEASLNIIHQYFYLVGSVWFFIEAIFLQYQIAMNVFNPSSTLKMKVLVAVAWGVPIVMLVPWIVLTHRRLAISHFENREQFFNTTLAVVNYNEFIQSAKSWRNVNDFDEIFVISALQLAMLIISFFILLNIVRIIMTKVRVTAGNDFEVFKKSVKATCSLLPLFGLSVIIGLYHKPQSSESLFPTFLILLQNLQGVFIATIYCFMNKDVQRMVKSRFTRVVQRHSSAFYSQGTQHSQLSVSEQLSQRWSKVVARISSNGSGRPTSSLLEASETGMTPANQTSSGLSSSLHQRPAGSTLTSI
ncbi:Oidioi.mRNA.OKI2018_I69.XSR.g13353.t1.cds [Oikopleura dioica]|uniref:Oidioi.mRNA.OKI2018_I69.XSR.g13353.t1.cds n=1 Tax=Oikopleura dioica TaxID=34765 RepID=A0ABN7SBT6_OIKDI|nr:Oidioi.mRNA.OKI2018_I69.XSR.g13353.t1.cds [Oikopleura dioica]